MILLILSTLLYDIRRTLLGLVEDMTYVFAQDTDAKQLHAPQEKHDAHEGGESAYDVAEEDGLREVEQQQEECKHGKCNA